jgi:micrococcal nuclease
MTRQLVVMLLVVVAVASSGCDVSRTPTPPVRDGATATRSAATVTNAATHADTNGMQAAPVVRVVDGDTIIVRLNGRDERLRYIGINTPETVKPNNPVECYGEAAHQRNEQLVGGQTVYLVKDISDRDQYDRLLRYVYVRAADGQLLFVNLSLVQDGYAQVSTFPPDVAHEQEFRQAQRDARAAKRGLWSACAG